MSKSQFDRMKLSQSDQNLIRQYQNNYEKAKTKEEKDSWHRMAESIRRKNGYSGGVSGDQYIPVPTFNPPKVPDIPRYTPRYENELNSIISDIRNTPDYVSPYEDRINQTLDRIQNRPEYKSPYEDLIKSTLNDIMNRPAFKYDPNSDKAYQAFKQRTLREGEQSAENALAGISANTGGRLNTWATSMSSQARNNARLNAEAGVAPFEARAFERYQFETNQNYNKLSSLQNLDAMEFNKYQASYQNELGLLDALQNLDSFSYAQYRDRITDKKDLANFVMNLDRNDFNRYQFMVEQTWQRYNAEYTNFTNELNFQKQQWDNALQRTDLLGYVNNQDSFILGVPSGTLSIEARKRQNAIDDFFTQSDYALKNELKLKTQQYEYEKGLMAIRQQYSLNEMSYEGNREMSRMRNSARYSGGVSGGNIGYDNVAGSSVNYAETPRAKAIVAKAESMIGTKRYKGKCQGFVADVYRDATGTKRQSKGSAKSAGNAWIKSNRKDNIPVGATLYFSSPYSPADGHVGIYVGDGKMIDATDTTVKKHKIGGWWKHYRGWGTNGNLKL